MPSHQSRESRFVFPGDESLQQMLIGQWIGAAAFRQLAYLLNHCVRLPPGHGLSTPKDRNDVPLPLYSARLSEILLIYSKGLAAPGEDPRIRLSSAHGPF